MSGETIQASVCDHCGAAVLYTEERRGTEARDIRCPPCAERNAAILALCVALRAALVADRLTALRSTVSTASSRRGFDSAVGDLRSLSEELRRRAVSSDPSDAGHI